MAWHGMRENGQNKTRYDGWKALFWHRVAMRQSMIFNSFTLERSEYISRMVYTVNSLQPSAFYNVYLCIASFNLWNDGKVRESVCVCVFVWFSRRFSSVCHFVPELNLVHRIWRTLAYVCMLHYALAYQKALLIRIGYIAIAAVAVGVAVVALSLYSMYAQYAYIYEWNIFAWGSDFPFIFAPLMLT